MKFFSITESPVYPGVMTSFQHLKDNLRKKKMETARKPKMRIYHSKEMWEIMMDFPGIEKKDLSAKITDRTLMVCAPSHPTNGHEEQINNCWYERHVELPGDADVLFVTAQFINGVLKIIIPRTTQPESINNEAVTIY